MQDLGLTFKTRGFPFRIMDPGVNELRMEGDLKEKFIYLYIAKGEDRLRIAGCFEER